MKHTTKTYRLLSAAILSLPLLLSACQAEQPDPAAAPLAPARLALQVTEAAMTSGGSPSASEQAANNQSAGQPSGATRAAATATGFNTANVKFAFSGGNVTDASGAGIDDVTGLTALQASYLAPGEAEAWVDGYLPAAYSYTDQTTFSVSSDQSQTDAGTSGYQASDLMYGTTRITRTMDSYATATAPLQLRHMMAQLRVTATSATKAITAVRLVSGYRTIAVDQARGCRLSAKTTLTDHSGLSDEITPSAPVTLFSGSQSAGSALTAVCLVPPQQLAASQALLEVWLDGIASPVRYRLESPQTMEGGRYYQTTVAPSPQLAGTTVTMTAWAQNAGTTTTPAVSQSAPNTYYVGTQAFKMVPVEPGTAQYCMYNTQTTPVSVTTTSKYYMAEVETTEALWNEVMAATGYTNGARYPKVGPSWNDICLPGGFLDRLNQKTEGQRPAGYKFCLPTVEQFRYAAAGGVFYSSSPLYHTAGGNDAANVCWNHNNSGDKPHEVATKRPNQLGLYDMNGNASEMSGTIYESGDNMDQVTRMGGDADDNSDGQDENKINQARCDQTKSTDGTSLHFGFRLCLRRVEVGDIYFSDGTWGSRQEYYDFTNGKWYDGKTPVGIVFSTAPSAADQQRGYRSGYAMALKRVTLAADQQWAASELQSTAVTGGPMSWTTNMVSATVKSLLEADQDGLSYCLNARAYCAANGISERKLTAIMAAIEYQSGASPSAPAQSSGWYLPSMGQIYMMYRASGHASFSGSESYTCYSNMYYYHSNRPERTGSQEYNQAVSTFMANRGVTGYDAFRYSTNGGNNTCFLLSSTEQSADNVLYVRSDTYGDFYFTHIGKTLDGWTDDIRPVLAF